MKARFTFDPDERFGGLRASGSGEVRPLFPGEHVDDMLRRLKRGLRRDNTLSLANRRSFFVSRGQQRRSKANAARKRAA